ncbi:MAG: archaeosortase A [Candidatus Thermoplasmatota archaeon]|nr:archaeosortase A [Candidatus Thermoplasmatota archaeon]
MEEPLGVLIGHLAEVLSVTDSALKLLICGLGAISLAVGFHRKDSSYAPYFSAFGWFSIGLFLYLHSAYYVEISDPILVVMTASALPVGIALGIWEVRNWDRAPEALIWFRGCVVWAVIPYFVAYSIPSLNMSIVYATAWNAEVMLEFAGLGSYQMGPMMVDLHGGGEIPVSEWGGNRWILTEPLGENGFFVPLEHSDGTLVSVSFILACSGLQSMIIFVGAIVALRTVDWKRRARALFIAVPTIHVLNSFRNAGIVWLTDSYPDWSFMGIEMFDFAHSYAAKAASLFAMFLMALALFDLLPELHRHIIRLLPSRSRPSRSTMS